MVKAKAVAVPVAPQSVEVQFKPDALLTAEEIAVVLECSVHTVYRMWKSGKLAKYPTLLPRARSRFSDVQALGWERQNRKEG